MATETAGRRRGRPVLGGISGFLFGLFLALVLLLPIVFLVIGVLLGLWPPLGFLRRG